MRITLEYAAVLKLNEVQSGGAVDLPEGTSIGELLGRLGVRAEQRRYLLPYVNGEKASLSRVLGEGDALRLFLPIGGG